MTNGDQEKEDWFSKECEEIRAIIRRSRAQSCDSKSRALAAFVEISSIDANYSRESRRVVEEEQREVFISAIQEASEASRFARSLLDEAEARAVRLFDKA